MKKLLIFLLCLAALFLAACTEAKRFLDADAKARPAPLRSDPSLTPKSGASPVATLAGSPSPKAASASATFSGDIAGKAGKRLLYQLLEKNNKKSVKLDLLLSDEQLGQMNEIDKGKKWYFDLAYEDKDGFNTGGELLLDISKGKGDLKLNGNHLTGSIIVTNWAGPHQGLMSINAKPVVGTTQVKPETTGKAAPSPSAKSPAVTKPRAM